MMHSDMYFDTHKHIKILIQHGIKEQQAESIVDLVLQSREFDISRLATKDQVDALSLSTKDQVDALNISTKDQINALQVQIDALSLSTKDQFDAMKLSMKDQFATQEVKINALRQEFKQDLKTETTSVRAEITEVKYAIVKGYISIIRR